MFSNDFLESIANTYGLTDHQKVVFLLRVLENKDHKHISKELGIEMTASLRRMTEVYKKFNIKGTGVSKDTKLREFLLNCLNAKNNNDVFDIVKSQEDLKAASTSSSEAKSPSPVLNNLPARGNQFIGRKNELKQLLQCLLEDYVSPIITINGIGGIGKTALILEVAHGYLVRDENASEFRFDAIVFVSTKEDFLIPSQIIKRDNKHDRLNEICKEIAVTLGEYKVIKEIGEEQINCAKKCLARKKTLLIIDNFETIDCEEKNKIISFLKDLPANVKSVITTREQYMIHTDIPLDSLSEEDAMCLIQQQLVEKSVELSNEGQKRIYQVSSGIPLAIIYIIGRLKSSIDLETLLEEISHSSNSDLLIFLFEKILNEIRGDLSHKIFMATCIFHEKPLIGAVYFVAGINIDTEPKYKINAAFEKLQKFSLLRKQNGRLVVLSPTREFAILELNSNLEFRDQAKKRLLTWYISLSDKYGGDDWGEWHKNYDVIDAEWGNFMEVLQFYSNMNEYDIVKDLWRNLNKCASLYGHWDDRLYWLDWLIDESERKGDFKTLVEMMTAKSWTLILKESSKNLEEAERIQENAWKKIAHADIDIQYILAENRAVLYIRQRKYDKARFWFDKYKELVEEANIDDITRSRSEIRYLYYNAEIKYREGKLKMAQKQYKKVLQLTQEIDWLRFEINTKSWLATIAIKLGDLPEAEKLLTECLPVTKRNKDKRRTAVCQFAYARLEEKRKFFKHARELAEQALTTLLSLGIERDVEDINTFINNLPKDEVSYDI
jgi:tetratricopeptide (TPR) repeat protein/archaellum biogenesis ATPase FlaH